MNLPSPPPYALKVLRRLEEKGYEAWFVGGCIRDSLLGRVPGDWDVTTGALPQEIKACFPQEKTVDTGISHGTVTVLMDGNPVEVTTFRQDGSYSDARHPDRVTFSQSLRQDLSRRDFTVNAMAYHPERGIYDPFEGLEDLNRKTLRCVGDGSVRFSEDALRILRCLRFSAVLGFSIDPPTRLAARAQKSRLSFVSGERIRDELTKLLCGTGASQILEEEWEILFSLLPELSPMKGCKQENPYHRFDVWEHTLHALNACPPEPVLRWAALLHDCGKPKVKTYGEDGTAHFFGHAGESGKIAETILTRLRFSNREREEITALVEEHGEILPISQKRVKRLLGRWGKEGVFRLFDLMEADISAQAQWLIPHRLSLLEDARRLTRDILSREECLSLKDLAVNGHDLLELGFSPGKELGACLSSLLDQVLSGAIPNRREDLLAVAKRVIKK